MSAVNRDTTSNDPKSCFNSAEQESYYDAERWIAAGKSLDISSVSKRRKPKSLQNTHHYPK